MPYKKTSKRTTTKKRPMKKRNYRKRKAPGPYRNPYARSIQFANLRPAHALVKFAARDKFLLPGVASANTKSVLQIPASFLGSPVAVSGTWNSDSGFFHVPQAYNEWFPKYRYYKVIGAKLTAVIRPSGIGEPGANQFNNKAFITLSPDGSTYTGVTALEQLEEGRDIVECGWKDAGAALGGWSHGRIVKGYSAKKVHNFKDYRDADDLRAATTFNTPANENTFFNVVISGSLDQATTGHAGCIVDVYGTYLVSFQEPDNENIPQAL